MEVEAQPLLIEDDEKLGSLMYDQGSRRKSRLWPWITAITTHCLVAIVVLLAVALSSEAGFQNYKLWNAESRPEPYCMFENGGCA